MVLRGRAPGVIGVEPQQLQEVVVVQPAPAVLVEAGEEAVQFTRRYVQTQHLHGLGELRLVDVAAADNERPTRERMGEHGAQREWVSSSCLGVLGSDASHLRSSSMSANTSLMRRVDCAASPSESSSRRRRLATSPSTSKDELSLIDARRAWSALKPSKRR